MTDFLDKLDTKDQLLELIRSQALQHGCLKLKSGVVSNYYLDLRKVTLHGIGANLVGRVIGHLAVHCGASVIAGPESAAIPIVTVAALRASLCRMMSGPPVCGCYVRKATKEHGTQRRIEGCLNPGDRVLLVDDVLTTGGSLLDAAQVIREAGGEIVRATCLVDRLQGAGEALAAANIPYSPMFTIRDLGITD